MKSYKFLTIGALLALTPPLIYSQPEPRREFRGTWIATVSNLDWPDSRDTPFEQKQDLIRILDGLQEMNINAVVFQVRTECDALYDSPYEPWSRVMTRTQGLAPSPLYDPLHFAIDEAHRRGMELHAWINPYRAGTNVNSTYSSDHVSRNGSSFVVQSGSNYWLDPGHPQTIPYTLQIVEDIVTRYDIDGFHIDDYFYPYDNGPNFPDTQTFATNNPGNLDLGDWRRQNTRNLVEGIYNKIRSIPGKDHVEFGVSPFGIYQPGIPSGISGLNSFTTIYIDSRQWLRDGIVDYMCPQLYWGRSADGYSSQQDYDTLIEWWSAPAQNIFDRHIYGGLPAYKVLSGQSNQLNSPQHIINQITKTRNTSGADGVVHFRTDDILSTSKGVGPLLESGVWSLPDAVVPASTWLDAEPPEAPELTWDFVGNEIEVRIDLDTLAELDHKRWIVVQSRQGGVWSTRVEISRVDTLSFPSSVQEIAIRNVDPAGNMSAFARINTAQTPTGLGQGNQWTILEDFESPAAGTSQYLFRSPGVSGSTQGIATGSTTQVTGTEFNNRLDPRVGEVGIKSNRLRFSFLAAGQGQVRATTNGGTGKSNPQIDLNQGLQIAMKIPSGSLDINILVRETQTTGPIGADGGINGPIEMMTEPLRINGGDEWTTLYFDLPRGSFESFSGGNGRLDGDFGVLEGLFISAVDGEPVTGYDLYVDDIFQGSPSFPFGPFLPEVLPVQMETEFNFTGYTIY